MNVMQVVSVLLEIFDIAWLSGVFLLLVAIWRNSNRYTKNLEHTQLDAAITCANAARETAETAKLLAEKVVAKDISA